MWLFFLILEENAYSARKHGKIGVIIRLTAYNMFHPPQKQNIYIWKKKLFWAAIWKTADKKDPLSLQGKNDQILVEKYNCRILVFRESEKKKKDFTDPSLWGKKNNATNTIYDILPQSKGFL